MNDTAIAIAILMGLGLLFGTVLAVAYKTLRVYEDPRIDAVEEMLPGANCGACGVPGCRAFATKVVGNELKPSKCTVSSPQGIEKVAWFLGVEAGKEEKRVARLLCAGGRTAAHNLADYKGGMSTCRGEATVAGGPKECTWGCLGLGDCEAVCDFDAIAMNDDALPVVDAKKCTACGDCVEICPKKLFVIMPVSRRLIVQCRSLLEGDPATDKCSVACNGCSRCAADAAPGVIEMKDNLAVVNYELNLLASADAVRRCPTGAIVWMEGDNQFEQPAPSQWPTGRVDAVPEAGMVYYQ